MGCVFSEEALSARGITGLQTNLEPFPITDLGDAYYLDVGYYVADKDNFFFSNGSPEFEILLACEDPKQDLFFQGSEVSSDFGNQFLFNCVEFSGRFKSDLEVEDAIKDLIGDLSCRDVPSDATRSPTPLVPSGSPTRTTTTPTTMTPTTAPVVSTPSSRPTLAPCSTLTREECLDAIYCSVSPTNGRCLDNVITPINLG